MLKIFSNNALDIGDEKMKEIINKSLSFFKNNILLIFILFICFMVILGIIYNAGLHPNDNKITELIKKFEVDNYTIPYRVAERYLTWFNMRTFFFTLNYILTLAALVASLLTVFYTSTDVNDENNIQKRKNTIVFLSLLSTCFTVANLFINAGDMANMSQHAWRELDSCIMKTVNEIDLSSNEKDKIITDKLIEMEKYIESYEH